MPPRCRSLAGLLVAFAAVAVVACAPRRAPTPPTEAPQRRTPLILVPGVTGTELRGAADGDVRFGRGLDILAPHDLGYSVVEPLAGGPRRVEAGGVIRRIRLGPIVKPVYEPLAELAARLGYREGDVDAPAATDSFFLFPYDWRRDNVTSAGALADLLERIRLSRGVDRLEVDLLCQSNGAHVCRWLAKYGAADLAAAESGDLPGTGRVTVRKLILVGTSNGGALRVLQVMNRGRRYLPAIGRFFSPECFFAMESLYQDLPFEDAGSFVDATGEALDVSLYDPDSWMRYGWSIFGAEATRRADRRPDLFGDAADRERAVTAYLDRARRFHRALQRDAPGFSTRRVHLLENVGAATPVRAVLEATGDGWRTRFAGDRWLDRRPALLAMTVAPGDGHASLASQRALSPQELAAVVEPSQEIHGPHFEAILADETHDAIAAALER